MLPVWLDRRVGTATATARQALTGGPTINLGSRAVDAMLGTYSFRLPVEAPVRAAYPSTTFSADTAVKGKYQIQVESPGRTTLQSPADVSSGSSATVNFAYGP